MDWPAAFELFKVEARVIWRNADDVLPRVALSTEEPERGVLASLARPGNEPVRAIGQIIFRDASHYTLRLAARLLVMDDAAIRRTLIHEAVHLGIDGHGKNFIELVRKHGGAVSGHALTTGDDRIKLQAKIGGRYRTVELFDDPNQARERARLYRLGNPGAKMRIEL